MHSSRTEVQEMSIQYLFWKRRLWIHFQTHNQSVHENNNLNRHWGRNLMHLPQGWQKAHQISPILLQAKLDLKLRSIKLAAFSLLIVEQPETGLKWRCWTRTVERYSRTLWSVIVIFSRKVNKIGKSTSKKGNGLLRNLRENIKRTKRDVALREWATEMI